MKESAGLILEACKALSIGSISQHLAAGQLLYDPYFCFIHIQICCAAGPCFTAVQHHCQIIKALWLGRKLRCAPVAEVVHGFHLDAEPGVAPDVGAFLGAALAAALGARHAPYLRPQLPVSFLLHAAAQHAAATALMTTSNDFTECPGLDMHC